MMNARDLVLINKLWAQHDEYTRNKQFVDNTPVTPGVSLLGSSANNYKSSIWHVVELL